MLYPLIITLSLSYSLICRYYLIDGLTQQLETHLQDLDEQLPICRVPVITCIEEEQKILSKSNKVRPFILSLMVLLCFLFSR